MGRVWMLRGYFKRYERMGVRYRVIRMSNSARINLVYSKSEPYREKQTPDGVWWTRTKRYNITKGAILRYAKNGIPNLRRN